MRRLFLPIATAMAVLLTACGSNTIDEALTDYRLDIVTYAGSDDGGRAAFDYYGRGDSLPVRLVSSWTHDLGARAGQRLLLRYNTGGELPAGGIADIKAYGVSAIVSDTLRVSSLAPAAMGADPVKLRSLWLTGPYLNVRCLVEHTGQHHRFGLVAEAATAGADTVVCHLVHSLGGFQAQQWQEMYASFLVGRLPVTDTSRVLRVVVDTDIVRPEQKTYDFEL